MGLEWKGDGDPAIAAKVAEKYLAYRAVKWVCATIVIVTLLIVWCK